jgi:hypothetical protein
METKKKAETLLYYFFFCCLDLFSAGLGSSGFAFFAGAACFRVTSLTSIDSLIELAS